MIRYTGKRTADGVRVTLDRPIAPPPDSDSEEAWTQRSPLPKRTDLRNHSPTGFEWGYEGSGPAQLALALVVDHLGRNALRAESAAITLGEEIVPRRTLADRVGVLLHQDFKRAVVVRFDRDGWTLTEDEIAKAIDSIVAKRRKGAA